MPEDRLGDSSVLTGLFRHNTWAHLKLFLIRIRNRLAFVDGYACLCAMQYPYL